MKKPDESRADLGEITITINNIPCDAPATTEVKRGAAGGPPIAYADSTYGAETTRALPWSDLQRHLSTNPDLPQTIKDTARIAAVSGKDGKSRVLKPGDLVYDGDKVSTRPPAKVG